MENEEKWHLLIEKMVELTKKSNFVHSKDNNGQKR
jgi:hypothetical protein